MDVTAETQLSELLQKGRYIKRNRKLGNWKLGNVEMGNEEITLLARSRNYACAKIFIGLHKYYSNNGNK